MVRMSGCQAGRFGYNLPYMGRIVKVRLDGCVLPSSLSRACKDLTTPTNSQTEENNHSSNQCFTTTLVSPSSPPDRAGLHFSPLTDPTYPSLLPDYPNAQARLVINPKAFQNQFYKCGIKMQNSYENFLLSHVIQHCTTALNHQLCRKNNPIICPSKKIPSTHPLPIHRNIQFQYHTFGKSKRLNGPVVLYRAITNPGFSSPDEDSKFSRRGSVNSEIPDAAGWRLQ